MADELQIAIKVDPAGSVPAISAVEDALAKAEARAKAFGALGPTFTKIAEHMRAMAAETAKARQAVDNLSSGFKQVADHMRVELLKNVSNAFGGLTQAIQREADALERIHGPARRLEEDLQALEMLNRRGAISAKEHAEQLAKLGRDPMKAVSLPGMPKASESLGSGFLDGLTGGKAGPGAAMAGELAGSLASIAGPAALAAAGISAIGDAIHEWQQRKQDVRDATNTILKFHDSIGQASAAMAEQEQLSEDLTINITRTAHAYADVREATEELGLSSKQVADITRNLSAALMVDGGSIEGVSAIMEKLRYSQEANVMGSRELKAIWNESPEVANAFARSLGKTYPELMKMAKEGKITGAQIEKMTVGLASGHEAIDKYKTRLMSTDRVMEEMHVGWMEAVEIIMKAKMGFDAAGHAAKNFAEIWEEATAHVQHTHDVLEKTTEKVTKIMALARAEGGSAAFEKLAKDGFKAQATIDGLLTPWEQYNKTVKDTTKTLTDAGIKGDELAKQLGRIHPPEWVDYYKQQLDAIQQPEKDWNGRLNALNALHDRNRITVDKYNVALKGLSASYAGIDLVTILADANGVTNRPKDTEAKAFERYQADSEAMGLAPGQGADPWREMGDFKIPTGDSDPWKMKDVASNMKDVNKGMTDFIENEKKATEMTQALGGAASSFSDTLVDAANGADVSWSKWGEDTLVMVEKLIAKGLLLKALGLDGSSNLTGGGLLSLLPGFATGGSFTVGGSGGTDTTPVAFMATPGERVTIDTQHQQQRQEQQSGGSSQRPLTIENHIDVEGRALRAFDGGAGDRVVLGVLRRNPGAVRALLSK